MQTICAWTWELIQVSENSGYVKPEMRETLTRFSKPVQRNTESVTLATCHSQFLRLNQNTAWSLTHSPANHMPCALLHCNQAKSMESEWEGEWTEVRKKNLKKRSYSYSESEKEKNKSFGRNQVASYIRGHSRMPFTKKLEQLNRRDFWAKEVCWWKRRMLRSRKRYWRWVPWLEFELKAMFLGRTENSIKSQDRRSQERN